MPYDSDAGRDYAACVTAIMCGEAYLQSSRIAEHCAPVGPGHRSHKEESGRNKSGSRHNPSAHVGTDASAVQRAKRALPARPNHARRSLPRLVHQPRTVPRRNPHAPRQRERHQQNQRPHHTLRSQQSNAGTKPSPTAKNTATATPRSPCSPPPAPSAS